ncbi:uncharacterized protein LOC110437537 [Sorghum bicolor]|uniref:uncharacterized protein LOC110437537 n=1 Tax=Sorghum bicolor TaxID=4558 RepID=UPI000B423842|nr:uncharacterized protein LOC110437537 [Sorghum bicolor]|eukprot:XP_021321683.1 uncharacterized protein LOC110437537 [Sorghum bicolor]
MSEDYKHNNQSSFVVEQMVLIDIQKLLESMQKDIKMYPLPDIDDTYDPSGDIPREIFEEASVEATIDDMALPKTLNKEQQTAYNEIMSTVDSDNGDEVTMMKRQGVEALDNSLRDIMERPNLPFGGKTVVFGGDFRQVLRVV